MLLQKIWNASRRVVPTRVYPFLAPIYQQQRRKRIKQLEADDRKYYADHPTSQYPSAELRFNVVGSCTIPQFIRGGELTVTDIQNALQTINLSLDQIHDFLDFGCGCGRLILGLINHKLPWNISGCDVDDRAISWCKQNIHAANCATNNPLPPLPFQNASFDLVWCGSVFTHLDETRQDLWLHELRRVLKPAGVLLASIHGPHCWESRLPPWTIAKLKNAGFLFARTGADAGIHPDWYQVAWHTENYVRNHWAKFFNIHSCIPRGFNAYQDVIVARKQN